MDTKAEITIPFDLLPEAQSWRVGVPYRVKLVVKQTGVTENNATFQIIDATSLEADDKAKRAYFSADGMIPGK